ncbi:MAG: methylmalonyl Co-A mutase-associated GTPase MeaB, partial [Actinobacteria bacterium]
MDAEKLASNLRSGDRRAIARLISLVEDEDPGIKDVVRALGPLAGNAYVIGITGSPGVGKSTLAAALVSAIRREDKKVSVLAVDPTSPFTG